MNRKQKRDAKNARHRRNEVRRAKRSVQKHYPHVSKLMGVHYLASVLQACRRK